MFISLSILNTASGGNATLRKQKQYENEPIPISVTFSGNSRENMDLHDSNMKSGIAVMSGGTLKLVNIQQANAPTPILSMSLWVVETKRT